MEQKKRNVIKWFGNIKRMKSDEFVKKVYVSEIDHCRRDGRKDRVKEYMIERGASRRVGLQQARCQEMLIVI